jgi:hypothetical protein
VALAGVALALWFFTANDGATTSGPAAVAPGQRQSDPARYAPALRAGNVVLEVLDARQRTGARALARSVAGPDDPALRAAGQAVILDPPTPDPPATGTATGTGTTLGTAQPDCATVGGAPADCPAIIAHAHGRALAVTSAEDPRLRGFLEYWLGRSSG